MAASLGLMPLAEALISCGFASRQEIITIRPALIPLTSIADRPSLFSVARLLLIAYPPLWPQFAVGDDGVRRVSRAE